MYTRSFVKVFIERDLTLREKCPYSKFSGPYFPTFGMNTQNKDQKNSEYEHFSRSLEVKRFIFITLVSYCDLFSVPGIVIGV